MQARLTMVCWRGDHFFLGKLLDHPEIMTQGETLEELEENLKDAYLAMVLDDVPDHYKTKAPQQNLWVNCGSGRAPRV